MTSRAKLAARVARSPGDRVLELGPGPGYFSAALRRRVADGHLALCDLQPQMLAIARAEAPGPGVSFVAGDATALPYRSGWFDVAVLVAVLGEVPDGGACLDELHRVLRPSGRLVVAETLGDPDRIPWPRLREMCERHGFEPLQRRGIRANYTAELRRLDHPRGGRGRSESAGPAW